MIQKTRQEFIPTIDKYQIDPFRNPYMTKLVLKIIPSVNQNKKDNLIKNSQQKNKTEELLSSSFISSQRYFVWASPFSISNIVYVSQALPIYRNQNFKFAILWRHNFKKRYANSYLGFSCQYKLLQSWRVKYRTLFGGSNTLTQLQIHKKINKEIDLMGYHSTLIQSSSFSPKILANSNIYNTIGVGIMFKKMIKVSLYHRMGFDLRLNTSFEKKIAKNLYLQIKTQSDAQNIQKSSEIQFGFSYYLLNKIKAYLMLVYNTNNDSQIGLKVQVQKNIEKTGNIIADVQLKQGKTVFYFGFKSPSFQISLPVFITDSLIPITLAGVIFSLGYFVKKRSLKQSSLSSQQKSQFQREQQLKLISDKANQNYQQQRLNNGLLIQQVYVGPQQLLKKLLLIENKGIAITRNKQFINKVFDMTICFRLYVMKGELKIPKGIRNKSNLIGYYNSPLQIQEQKQENRQNRQNKGQNEMIMIDIDKIKQKKQDHHQQIQKSIYVNYTLKGINYQKIYKQYDSIQIK